MEEKTLVLKRNLRHHYGWIAVLVVGFLVAGVLLVEGAFIARAIGTVLLLCLIVATFRIHWTRNMLIVDRVGITPLYRSRERIPWGMVGRIIPYERERQMLTKETLSYLRIEVQGRPDIVVPVSAKLHPKGGIVRDIDHAGYSKTLSELIHDIESLRTV